MMRILFKRCVFVLTALFSLLLLSSELNAEPKELSLPKLREATLKGGFKVRMLERHQLPLVTLELSIQAGSASDPKGKEGLARFVSQMLRSGAGNLDAASIATKLDGMGATLRILALRDYTRITLEVLSEDLEEAVGLLATLVRHPTFEAEELEKVRRRSLAYLSELRDNPQALADMAFLDQLYRGHPYGHPVVGYEHTLSALTREDVLSFHKGAYRPEKAFLVAVGDFRSSSLKRMLKKSFSGWKKETSKHPRLELELPPVPEPIEGQKVILVHQPRLTQTQIRIGNLGINAADEDRIPLEIANTELGGSFTSRLVEEIRVNRSLSYRANSYFGMWKLAGPFTISTFTKNETVAETIKVALDTARAFSNETLSLETLQKAKKLAAGYFAREIQTSDALAHWLTRIEIYGQSDDFLEKYPISLGAVDLGRAQGILSRIPTENVLIVLYGDKEALAGQLKELQPVKVVEDFEYRD